MSKIKNGLARELKINTVNDYLTLTSHPLQWRGLGRLNL
jgi:hypothetical protein